MAAPGPGRDSRGRVPRGRGSLEVDARSRRGAGPSARGERVPGVPCARPGVTEVLGGAQIPPPGVRAPVSNPPARGRGAGVTEPPPLPRGGCEAPVAPTPRDGTRGSVCTPLCSGPAARAGVTRGVPEPGDPRVPPGDPRMPLGTPGCCSAPPEDPSLGSDAECHGVTARGSAALPAPFANTGPPHRNRGPSSTRRVKPRRAEPSDAVGTEEKRRWGREGG